MLGLQTLLVVTLFLLATGTDASTATAKKKKPNIVFLVVESTDGRTWQEGYQGNVIPLPNLRQLAQAEGGYAFHRHYSNTPVCCPSRATLWSGRHAHKIPHIQRQQSPNSGNNSIPTHKKELPVNGVWNNFEGLPPDFDLRIDQILQRHGGYTTHLAGKLDFTAGGHSENVRLSAWTMYTRFPYNLHQSGGWAEELPFVCADNGTVLPSTTRSAHASDWATVNQTVDWIRQYHHEQQTKKEKNTKKRQSSNVSITENEKRDNNKDDENKPFFVYQGMNIVHPPYRTNEYYYDKIDPAKIRVPEWPPLEDLHPCDFQSSMLKGCIPNLDNATAVAWIYSKKRRRNIRRIYYAMIAEFDAMVGAYMDAIRDIGEWDNTVFIVTSDHGDMQMEHQQGYKMAPYESSASVPLIIYDGRRGRHSPERRRSAWHNLDIGDDSKRIIDAPTQLIDVYPTIMELAGVSHKDYPRDALDGHSLVPLMACAKTASTFNPQHTTRILSTRPDFVVSQFHGTNIAMSWFLIVRPMPCADEIVGGSLRATCDMKLVIYGTGNETEHQLFDLTRDPDEMINLSSNPSYSSVVSSLEEALRSVVDYPRVALDVASYNLDSMKNWIEVTPQWQNKIHAKLRWDDAFERDIAKSFKALEEWLHRNATVLPCRSGLVWPPKEFEPISAASSASNS